MKELRKYMYSCIRCRIPRSFYYHSFKFSFKIGSYVLCNLTLTLVMHELTALWWSSPSSIFDTVTVHEPHPPSPHPIFVPRSPKSPRKKFARVLSFCGFTNAWRCPFTVSTTSSENFMLLKRNIKYLAMEHKVVQSLVKLADVTCVKCLYYLLSWAVIKRNLVV